MTIMALNGGTASPAADQAMRLSDGQPVAPSKERSFEELLIMMRAAGVREASDTIDWDRVWGDQSEQD
jgi:hypothetical protein